MKKYILLLCLCITGCANPNLGELDAKSTSEVRLLRGNPVSIVRENNHEMWIYREGECTLMVFFDERHRAVDAYKKGVCPVEK